MNPNASLITGTICGCRVEEIDDPPMQKTRYLDTLVDDVARGKKMSWILRGSAADRQAVCLRSLLPQRSGPGARSGDAPPHR